MFETEFFETKKLLSAARRIVIISHKGPDGDTVGSNLALRIALREQWGKEVISACVDSPPQSYDFLQDFKEYVSDFDLAWPDLAVAVDCGAHYMMKFHETKPELLKGSPPLINIDHHPSNDRFGKINIVDDGAAAAAQIVYRFLIFCGFKITRNIATCLLHGLYYDTGSFMHSNTSPAVLEIASALMWKGADFKTIVRRQFHTMPVKQLRVYGRALERAQINSKHVATSVLMQKDFAELGANSDDTTGLIDFLNWIPEGKFCCFLYEDRRGMLKGSLRTRDDEVNLSKVAGLFGGGGHKKASGFSLPGRLRREGDEVKIE